MKNLVALALILTLLTAGAPAADQATTAAIDSAAKSYLRTQAVTGEVRIELEAVEGNFARARVVPLQGQTDTAYLFLKKSAGGWKGVTIGTAFTDADYAELKIPRALRIPRPTR